jgi:hypothetical protein
MSRGFLLILMVTVFAVTVYAQADQQAQTGDKELKKSFLYQWTDEKGGVHITDDLAKVPKDYRDKAITIQQPNMDDADQKQQVKQPSGYSSGTGSDATDAAAKAMWQQRMRAAKQRQADAEQHYQELAQQRDELLQSWGGPASGQLSGRIEADKIEQEMKSTQDEISRARNEIDVVIPEAARKAGLPPGWLRE